MAVQDEDSFKRYAANGIATVYAIPFLLLNEADLQVVLNGTVVTVGFTVSGVGTNTGSITFSVAPSGDLLLQRVVSFERLTDYQDNGDLLADTVNRDFDRLWLAMQELRRDDSTALRTSPLEPEGTPNLPLAAQRASRVLAFGPTGDPVVSSLTLDELEQQPALAIAAADAAVAAAGAASSSASAAASSAAAAESAEEKAQQWAEEEEDIEVEPGKYSAKHWASKAESSVTGLDTRVTDLETKGLKRGTAQSATSGTAIDFTGIPSWAQKITVLISGLSTNGSSLLTVRVGTSSGFLVAGYAGSYVGAASAALSNGFTPGGSNSAADIRHCVMHLTKVSGNLWVAESLLAISQSAGGYYMVGSINAPDALDRIRITTVNGTDVFDAGSVNIIYEG